MISTMDIFRKTAVMLLLSYIGLFLYGCEKADSEQDFGYNYIFIPQATATGGGTLNDVVPTGNDAGNFNYKVDAINNKVNILLGVSCSGKTVSKGYTVSIATRADTVTQLISNGTLKADAKTVVLLPSTAYFLPSTVTVPDGQYMASFYLSVDEGALKAYAGQKVALCVALSNPTSYKLSPSYNKVIVIIDVDALKLI